MSNRFLEVAESMAKVGQFLAERGWSPATSSNYSHKLDTGNIAITRSGVNKFNMSATDIIEINAEGQLVMPKTAKSSAETLIHTSIYKLRPLAMAVLHTHSPHNTRLSLKYASKERITFDGYELQKGIFDVQTHEGELHIPILPNAQNMTEFAKKVENLLTTEPDIHGFLIAGHGLYTWGRSLDEARRHVETYEFLFQCKVLELTGV